MIWDIELTNGFEERVVNWRGTGEAGSDEFNPKVFKLTTAPVLGGDKKTAIAITNYPNPINHTMMQAKVVSCSYNDGKHKFNLKGSNAFFNTKMGGSGKA